MNGTLITHVTELTLHTYELLIGLQDLLQVMIEEANDLVLKDQQDLVEEPVEHDPEWDPGFWEMVTGYCDIDYDWYLCWEQPNHWAGSAYWEADDAFVESLRHQTWFAEHAFPDPALSE